MQHTQVTAPAYSTYSSAIARIPDTFGTIGHQIYSGRNTLQAIPAPEGSEMWVAKRYKRPNIFQRIAYRATRRSKARKAYECGIRIEELGFRTPRPIAMIDITSGNTLEQCYFVSGMSECRSLMGLFADNPNPPADIAEELARFIATLHAKGILHGDLNLSNILYDDTASGNDRFILIDTNRTKFKDHLLSRRRCITNLVRLTHWRPSLKMIVEAYARQRGWDENTVYSAVESKLKRFELSRRVRHTLKRLLPSRK